MTPSNEHLVHEHVAKRLAAAEAHRAQRPVADGHEERHGTGAEQRRFLPTIALPLHPTRKGIA